MIKWNSNPKKTADSFPGQKYLEDGDVVVNFRPVTNPT